MLKSLARKFVTWWIRNHMAHEFIYDRSLIFNSIRDGCVDAFYNDTITEVNGFVQEEMERSFRRQYSYHLIEKL